MALVLDPSLSGPLGLVAEVREFREHGIEKIYHLLPEPLQTECTSIVYIIRPQLRLAGQVASQVRALEKARGRNDPPRTYALYFLPRRSMLCEKVLAEEGVHKLLTVRELPLPFFVLEDDVLSLEHPGCFADIYLHSDRSALHTCAASLARVQAVLGRIPVVRGKGECSQTIVKTMQRMMAAVDEAADNAPAQSPPTAPPGAPRTEVLATAAAAAMATAMEAAADVAAAGGGGGGGSGSGGSAGPAQIRELLLLDRDVDLVTPMCTELTYEGLIHQTFGIAHGYVDIDPEIMSAAETPKPAGGAPAARLLKKELNNNDPLYGQIRNLNFGELGPLLNRLARGVSDGYEERHQAQTVSQIRDYMKKLSKLQQEHKSLSTHVALAERIQRVTKEPTFHRRLECEQEALQTGGCSTEAETLLEDLAITDEPLPSVLRLLCLLSIVCNGLRPKTLAALQSELNHAYGYQRLALTWPALARAGMLKKQESRNHWTTLRKGLRLVVDSLPEHELGEEPADFAYVYAGYAPLSVRLLHAMLTAPPSLDEMTRLLPGPYFSHIGPGASELPPAPSVGAASGEVEGDASEIRPPVTLVFFVGGCTFAEIAALRWLGRNGTPRREYLIATTHICNGDTLMESLITVPDNALETLEL